MFVRLPPNRAMICSEFMTRWAQRASRMLASRSVIWNFGVGVRVARGRDFLVGMELMSVARNDCLVACNDFLG